MRLRLVFLSILLSALAANPCFAKNGHAQHGARASAANSGTSGKGAGGPKPPANNANASIDAGETVAPPVLPPHGQQQMRTRNPSVKIVIPVNPSRGQTTASPGPARNAIGQFVTSPRNFVGPQPTVSSSALPRPGAGSSTITHGAISGSAASVVPSGAARVANAANRGSINGASAIHPTTAPPIIGGPATARYGINGTTVQNKH